MTLTAASTCADSMTTSLASTPVAVVTGGARGIGQWFLPHGHRVALIEIDGETLARTEASLDDTESVLAVHHDESKSDQVRVAIEAVVGPSDASMRSSTTRALRYSRAAWRRRARNGATCSVPTSRARSSAPRPAPR